MGSRVCKHTGGPRWSQPLLGLWGSDSRGDMRSQSGGFTTLHVGVNCRLNSTLEMDRQHLILPQAFDIWGFDMPHLCNSEADTYLEHLSDMWATMKGAGLTDKVAKYMCLVKCYMSVIYRGRVGMDRNLPSSAPSLHPWFYDTSQTVSERSVLSVRAQVEQPVHHFLTHTSKRQPSCRHPCTSALRT